MKNTFIKGLVAGLTLAVSGISNATIIPSGVLNDVNYNTVVDTWGWEVLYRGDYNLCSRGGNGCLISDLFANVNDDDYIMLAGIADGSDSFDVLASALWSDVSTVTMRNQTHAANGASWYFNGYSMGFTALGTAIAQNSGDIREGSARTRLSWHTSDINGVDSNNAAYYLNQGTRSGSNLSLNLSSSFDRVILINRSSSIDVPEPSTLAIFSLAMLGLASRKLTKKA